MPIVPGYFLCGCDPSDPHVKNYSIDLRPGPDGTLVQSGKRFDKEGNEICPIHGKKMYGSAMPMKRGSQGNDIHDYEEDFKRRYKFKISSGSIVSTVPDLRDNRDPEMVGREYLTHKRRSGSKTNGH